MLELPELGRKTEFADGLRTLPTEVSDGKSSFAAPYPNMMDQRENDLHKVFNALHWPDAGGFEAIMSDLFSIFRMAQGR